jgi:FkbM family methyltransferase
MFLEECITTNIKDKNLVVHCGGHTGQEFELYEKSGFFEVLWIEAIPDLADFLKSKFHGNPGHRVINTALWSKSDEILDFHISSNAKASSSILTMKNHRSSFPEVHVSDVIKIRTKTLDEIMAENLNVSLLLLDLQGVELEVLKGAEETLKRTEFIYTEVSLTELYTKQALFSDILIFLNNQSFFLHSFEIVEKSGHGNAFFTKIDLGNETTSETLIKIKDLELHFSKRSRTVRAASKLLFLVFGVRHFLLRRGIPIRLMRRPEYLKKRAKG